MLRAKRGPACEPKDDVVGQAVSAVVTAWNASEIEDQKGALGLP